MTLFLIVLAAVAGGIVSVTLAALIAWRVQPRLIPMFVSFAVGALLGVVFLDLLPHIFESTTDYHGAALWILGGILGFFVLEKLVLWRHSHDHGHVHSAHAHDGHGHAQDMKPGAAWTIIIGDAFHNFTDGITIAAAFVVDIKLGFVTAVAIIAHELPQELGDFLVLLNAGFSKSRALFWNLVSSGATVVGGVLGYLVLTALKSYEIFFLCLAASSMMYVAIADLIPGLQRKTSLKDSLLQFGLIGCGVATIGFIRLSLGHSH
jgi:zinc and cadmium transporter